MVQTITPVVHGGRGGSWGIAVALHAAGAAISAAALGSVLAVVGAVLGAPWGRSGFLLIAGIAALYLVREALGVSVPVPELRRQVPEWWRGVLSPKPVAFLYGLGLGVGFVTYLRHGTLVAVGVAAVASGDPSFGTLVIAPFGLARGLSVLAARPARRQDLVMPVTERLEAWAERGTVRVANAVALVAVGAAAAWVAMRTAPTGTSGLAPVILAGAFAWAAGAKAFRFAAWRRTLTAFVAPPFAPAVAFVVPLAEAASAGVLLMDPRAGALSALALLTVFSAAIVRARNRIGDRLPCGCFGRGRTRDYRTFLGRNAAIGAFAVLIVAKPRASFPELGILRGVEVLPALLALAGASLAVVALRQAVSLLRAGMEGR